MKHGLATLGIYIHRERDVLLLLYLKGKYNYIINAPDFNLFRDSNHPILSLIFIHNKLQQQKWKILKPSLLAQA